MGWEYSSGSTVKYYTVCKQDIYHIQIETLDKLLLLFTSSALLFTNLRQLLR